MEQKRYLEPRQNYKALVRCYTYNQSKYIVATLNGFAMQKTNFPFVCLVVDDCSTDGEKDVIKAWIRNECNLDKAEYINLDNSHVILIPHKANKSCTFAIYLLKRNLWDEPIKKRELITPWREHCEYEALCEGDDYWIDPLKLQKQVDILDKNPNVTLVHTGFINVNENNKEITRPNYEHHMGISKSENVLGNLFINGNYILTMTTCYRIEVVNSEIYKSSSVKIDYLLALCAASMGDIYYLPEKTAAYRLDSNSLTNKHSKKVLGWITKSLYHVGYYYLSNQTRSVSKEEDILIKKILIYKSFKSKFLYKEETNKSYFFRYLKLCPSLIIDLIEVLIGKIVGKYQTIG